MNHQRYRLSGYVEERICQKCGSDGMHYTLFELKSSEQFVPMMQLEATCPECTYNWVETYEMVPNRFFDDNE